MAFGHSYDIKCQDYIRKFDCGKMHLIVYVCGLLDHEFTMVLLATGSHLIH